MKSVIQCVCVWLMMLLLGGGALAAEMFVQRVDGVGEPVSVWTKSNGKQYLFLPAYMENQPLRIAYSGVKNVRLGEMPLESGTVTDAICGGASLAIGQSGMVSVMASANLPAVHITTHSGSLDHIHAKKGNQETGHIRIISAQGETVCDAPLELIKGHGNATFVYEKKSYQIKLEEKAALLGMDAAKTYVLLANQHENTFLRNRITFALARALDLPYTPECTNVDLYVNGEYRGSYLLCDKVTIASGSVEITDSEKLIEAANEAYIERGGEAEPYGEAGYQAGTFKGAAWPREPQDITGGFLFELEYQERYTDETSGIVTPQGQHVVIKEPKEMGRQQGQYAYELLSSFERAIFSRDGVDPQTDRHYTEIADFDSLVRKYMIEEVCKNYDGNKSSQYFFKDSDAVDPMLYAGPVWDYDSAWGNYAQKGRLDVAGPAGLSIARQGFDYSWWPALYRQDDFRKEVRHVYDGQLCPLLEVLVGERAAQADSAVQSLDTYAAEIEASADMNFVRWRVLNHASRAVKTGASYRENIEYLRNWIMQRMEYLDKNW